MNEKVLLHTEVSNSSDDGCALVFWITLTFFAGCLGAALHFAGYHAGELFRTLFRVFTVPIVIGVLIHIVSYLARTNYSLTVTDTAIMFQSTSKFKNGTMTKIPFAAVKSVYATGNILCIASDQRTYNFYHIADPAGFAAQMNAILREHGVNPANDYASFARANLAELDRKQNRAELVRRHGRIAVHSVHQSALPAQTVSQIPVTQQNGQPILPQRLTDEQAEGIFRAEPQEMRPEPRDEAIPVPLPDFVPPEPLYRDPAPVVNLAPEEDFFRRPESFLPDAQADAFFRQPPPFQEDEQETGNPVFPDINEQTSNEEESHNGREDYF